MRISADFLNPAKAGFGTEGFLGLSFGIYKQKTVLFIGLIVVFAAVGYFISRQFTSASVQDVSVPSYSGVYTVDVNIDKNGKAVIGNKNVSRFLTSGQNNDEFRYLVADEEGTYINQIIVNVRLPEPVSQNEVKQISYAVHGVESYNNYLADPQTLVYEGYGLAPGATFTIVAELPKGMINFPWYKKISSYFSNLNFYVWLAISAIPLLVVIIILIWLYIHQTSDWKLPKIKDEINTLPSDLTPAEVEVLLYGKVSNRSIAATLIDLAQRGYIYIVHKGDNFSFGKRKTLDFNNPNDSGLRPFEKIILSKIFTQDKLKSNTDEIMMRLGKHVFSRKIAEAYYEIYQSIVRRGYFQEDPQKYHQKFRNLGIGLFLIAIIGFIFGILYAPEPKYPLIFWATAAISSIVIIKWAPQLPTRNAQGKDELIKWLRFKNFLINPQTMTDHGSSQDVFKKYLPYAIVMRAEVEWAKRIMGEAFISPDWFVSMDPTVTLEEFINNLYPLVGFVSQSLSASKEPIVQ